MKVVNLTDFCKLLLDNAISLQTTGSQWSLLNGKIERTHQKIYRVQWGNYWLWS